MAATPTGFLFYDGRAKPLSTLGQFMAGCYLQFYLTGTTTLTNVYADGALATPLSQTPGTGGTTAASDGRFTPIYLNPATVYRYQLYTAGAVLLEDVDPFVVPTNGNQVTANLANPATGFGVDLVANAVKSYDVVTSVRAANVPALSAGQTLIIMLEGGASVGDGLGGAFYWSASSSATDDGGTTTIKPTAAGATGRFLRLTALTANQGNTAANTVVISQNTVNFNLANELGNPGGVITATVTVNAGVRVIATDPTAFAMDLSGLASGSTITLTNNGYILGRGGNGGDGGGTSTGGGGVTANSAGGQRGRNGGAAIQAGPSGVTLNINNSSGFIWGGGGGGGGGGADIAGSGASANGGGGGGGAGGSLGGNAGRASIGGDSHPGVDGGDGTWVTSGANGAAGTGNNGGKTAGAAGDWGAAGAAGTNGAQVLGGPAGAAGKAVSLNGGTVNFNSGGTAPNVKGAVS
jgi:hypothetical protein